VRQVPYPNFALKSLKWFLMLGLRKSAPNFMLAQIATHIIFLNFNCFFILIVGGINSFQLGTTRENNSRSIQFHQDSIDHNALLALIANRILIGNHLSVS
jgi:hypothetical protein